MSQGFDFVYGESKAELREVDHWVKSVKETEVVATLAPQAMHSEGIVTDTLVDLDTMQ